MRLQSTGGVAWVVAILIGCMTGCGRSSPPPDAPSTNPPPAAGPTPVNGSERLAWQQSSDMPYLSFVAYVDGEPTTLDDVTCNWTQLEAQCEAPLPPMSDGMHTIALAARNPLLNQEGAQSGSITVQKGAARSVVSVVSVPGSGATPDGPRSSPSALNSAGDGFVIDVVARGLRGPVQLAATPDGRLLIAEGDTGVRLVRPGRLERADPAFDARLLQSPLASGLGVAVHPEFARNQFVYVSFLFRDREAQTTLRIVRLREVGDTLGEPLSLFEAPLASLPEAPRPADDSTASSTPADQLGESPRLAFGPDGLLYALLPMGFEFDNEPAASSPRASMLRVDAEGRVPRAGGLTGVNAHPLGFAWHPSTAAMWLILPGVNGATFLRPNGVSATVGSEAVGSGVFRMTRDTASSSGALVLDQAGALNLAGTLLQGFDHESIGVLRLVMPVMAEGVVDGVPGRITDVIPGEGGTVYLTTNDGGGRSDGGDVVLRLTPRAR